ncbi:MAG TPA: discoidin domain-containing protein [Abditibacteriaceae bacterium]|jgi:hypothetical protein
MPYDPDFIGRQLCLDTMQFTADGLIEKVTPTHQGPPLVQGRDAKRNLAENAGATASSQANEHTGAQRVLDDNYATRWAAAKNADGAWLQLDLGTLTSFQQQELRFEYAWKPYCFVVEISDDGRQWQTLADFRDSPVTGSPVLIKHEGKARFLRLVFSETDQSFNASLFEWAVF